MNVLLLLLSTIFPNDFHNNRTCLIDSNEYRSRPELDTFAPSPSNHFYIHYDIEGIHAPDLTDEYGINSSTPNNIPDYIDEVALMADNVRQIMVNQFNFLEEIDDSDGVYDIYIKNKGYYNYGINIPDNEIPGASYIEIDNKYEEGSYYTSGLNTMRLTLAHEYFHAIQRSYNNPAFGHGYFWEMTATFIEDIIVPDGNDYIFWVNSFFENPNDNISSTDGYSIALFGHYLKDVIGGGSIDIIREMWEDYSTSNNPLISIRSVLSNNYGTTFQYTWSDFTSRNFFNGDYQNMNNDIYYYIDQKDVIPISSLYSNLSNPDILNETITINDLLLTNESSDHIAFSISELSSINLEHFSSDELEGFVSIKSNQNINLNKHIYIDEYLSDIHLGQEDVLFFTYASNNTEFIDVVINYSSNISYQGDCNLDDEIDILDIVLLVEFIFLESIMNQLQFENSDINFDNDLNIFDIILLVELILN